MPRLLSRFRALPLVAVTSVSLVIAGAPVAASAAPTVSAAAVKRAAVVKAQPAKALRYAKAQIGDPYRYGAAGPSSFDCSGLTMRSYAKAGRSIGGHSASGQYRWARAHHRLVSTKHLKTGDILFYGYGSSPYHVAIYAGKGKMVESPHEGARVRQVALRHGDLMSKASRPSR